MKLSYLPCSALTLIVYLLGLVASEIDPFGGDGEIEHSLFTSQAPSSASSDLRKSRATTPNILFIMSDDQGLQANESQKFANLPSTHTLDLLMNSMDAMPNVKSLLADNGITYNRHYCTNALCCPSRASILTGKCTQSVHRKPTKRDTTNLRYSTATSTLPT